MPCILNQVSFHAVEAIQSHLLICKTHCQLWQNLVAVSHWTDFCLCFLVCLNMQVRPSWCDCCHVPNFNFGHVYYPRIILIMLLTKLFCDTLHDVLHTCTCPNSAEFMNFVLQPDIWQMMTTCSTQLSCGCIPFYNPEYATGWHCLNMVFLHQYCDMHLALYFPRYWMC
jgi:hypothetical protein